MCIARAHSQTTSAWAAQQVYNPLLITTNTPKPRNTVSYISYITHDIRPDHVAAVWTLKRASSANQTQCLETAITAGGLKSSSHVWDRLTAGPASLEAHTSPSKKQRTNLAACRAAHSCAHSVKTVEEWNTPPRQAQHTDPAKAWSGVCGQPPATGISSCRRGAHLAHVQEGTWHSTHRVRHMRRGVTKGAVTEHASLSAGLQAASA